MNRLNIAAGLSALGAVALWGQAMAVCPVYNESDKVNDIGAFLLNKTVCMKKTEQWTDSKGITTTVEAGYQEEHLPSNELWDYKQGPTPPSTPFPNPPSADPRKQVGTWTTNGDQVTYKYDGPTTYIYKLYALPSSGLEHYCLVGNGEQLQVRVQDEINAPCTAYPATN